MQSTLSSSTRMQSTLSSSTISSVSLVLCHFPVLCGWGMSRIVFVTSIAGTLSLFALTCSLVPYNILPTCKTDFSLLACGCECGERGRRGDRRVWRVDAGCSLHIQSCHLPSTLSCHFLSCTFMLIVGAPPLRARHSHFTCALCHGLGRLPPDPQPVFPIKECSEVVSSSLHSTVLASRNRPGFLVISIGYRLN